MILRRLRRPAALRALALAFVIANVVIVVTGGAVRLTNSGLGCPTWPSCTDASLTPTPEYAVNGVIEFSNRLLSVLLGLLAVVTLLTAFFQRRQRRLAVLAFAIIPVQAVIGGISVRTELNPWVVALHFLASMAAIAVTFVLWWRLRERTPIVGPVPPAARWLAWVVVAVAAIVLTVGTVVTGSGPHAGDRNASGRVHRTGLSVSSMTQLHADLVMVLIGLTVGLLALVYALRLRRDVQRAAGWLLAAELAQGAVGYTQYFLGVPPALVAVHMLGACLVWIAALSVLLRVTTGSQQLAHRVDEDADQRAHDRPVHADELQVAPDL